MSLNRLTSPFGCVLRYLERDETDIISSVVLGDDVYFEVYIPSVFIGMIWCNGHGHLDHRISLVLVFLGQ